jgi:hypothetical protein
MLQNYSYSFDLKDRFSPAIKKIGGGLASANANLQMFGAGVARQTAGLNRMGSGLMNIRNLLIGSFVTQGLMNLGGEVINTLGEFERMEAVLTNTLGSGSMAEQVMSDITDFATRTPFQVNELTDSWVRLANQGFRPNMDQMMSLSDLASSTGKDFNMLSEAIIDAQVGEFERLKEFGIRASKSGDQVTFSFKGQQKQVKFTEDAIQGYLLSLGQLDGVQGASAAIMETTSGKVSNFWDNVTQLKLAIGEGLRPQIHGLIEGASGLVQRLTSIIPWVQANSEVLLRWGKVIMWTGGTFLGLWAASKTILGIGSMLKTVSVVAIGVSKALRLAAAGQWLLNVAMGANPIGALVIGIAAAVGAVVYLWKNFEGFRNFFVDFGKFMWENHPFKWMIDLVDRVFPGFKGELNNLLGGVIDMFKSAWNWLSENIFKPIKEFFGSFFDFKDPVAIAASGPEFGKKSFFEEDPYSPSGGGKGASGSSSVGVNKAVGAAVSGGGGNVKNITINVDALNKGGITISTSTIGMGTQQLKAELERLLLSVVNDANYG